MNNEVIIPEVIRDPVVDRKGWPSGLWDNEPDVVRFEHLGFPCIISRNGSGAWCGYVAVTPGHPWYKKHDSDVEAEVHGGLTYASHCAKHICHIPKPGESDTVWWLGFDAAHSGDLIPGNGELRGLLSALNMFSLSTANIDQYRSAEYMTQQCKQLAQQAVDALPNAVVMGDADAQ